MSKRLLSRFLAAFFVCVTFCACSSATSSTVPPAAAVTRPGAIPHASVVANITFLNRLSAHSVYAYVDYSYNYNPIWINEAKTCVAPGSTWKTSVTYNHSDRGPQVRIRADEYEKGCNHVFPFRQRELSFKDFPFNKEVANFDADYGYSGRDGIVLCAGRVGNASITCAWR